MSAVRRGGLRPRSSRAAALVASRMPLLKSLRMLLTNSGGRRWKSCFFSSQQPLTVGGLLAIPHSWGRCPHPPGVYRMVPMSHGMNHFMSWSGYCPLASPAAPLALRQSRILWTMCERHQQAAHCQSLCSQFKEIRFCSVSLSAFAPAPTTKKPPRIFRAGFLKVCK